MKNIYQFVIIFVTYEKKILKSSNLSFLNYELVIIISYYHRMPYLEKLLWDNFRQTQIRLLWNGFIENNLSYQVAKK